MNDIKVFITVEMTSEDLTKRMKREPTSDKVIQIPIPDRSAYYNERIVNVIDLAYELIVNDIPTQIKITNLPPRRSGFIKASELESTERG